MTVSRAGTILVCCFAAIALASCGSGSTNSSNAGPTPGQPINNTQVKPVLYPAYVTPYDVMTPEDALYYHYLGEMCHGSDIAKWPLVKDLIGLGQDLVDADMLAKLANETIPITNQPRAKPIIQIVEECAEILDVTAPQVYIQPGAPNAYVAGLKEPHTLVLSSGLLDLYQESPKELRFIIGHELGHIKTEHIRTHFLGRTFVSSLMGEPGSKASFKSQFVATLSVATLLHWFRESEYSADRAGLLCIGGDVEVAKQGLLRLLHQTRRPSNKLFDPNHPEFDVDLVLERQFELRQKPFVEIVSHLRQSSQTHPFIPERCAALERWQLSSDFAEMLARKVDRRFSGDLVVSKVSVTGIPNSDFYVPGIDSGQADPIVKITHCGKGVTTEKRVDSTDASWEDEFAFPHVEGAGVIVELFDYNLTRGNILIGSSFVPVNGDSGQVTVDLRMDVARRSTVIELPKVAVTYRLTRK